MDLPLPDFIAKQFSGGIEIGKIPLISGASSSFLSQMYWSELMTMMSSMAISHNSGIGYLCLEHTDFDSLEKRLMDAASWKCAPGLYPEHFHDEFVFTDFGPRGYVLNSQSNC